MKKTIQNRGEKKRPDLWFLYRQMLRARLFEQRVKEIWQKGLISGEMHLGLGEEAVAAGVVSHLEEGDALILDHRGTPPLIIRGIEPASLLKEFMGRPDGLCRGFGGHMHLFSRDKLCASSGIVGASGPLASGFALACQHLRPNKLAVAFFGEGAMNQGMLLESLNLAAVWKLPVIFVCKDNKLAITTRSPRVTSGSLLERAKGFGLQASEVDGTAVEELWQATAEATQRARSGKGPVFLLAHCCHLEGHFLGDPFLRFVQSPWQQMKKILWPLIRTVFAKGGTRLRHRLLNLAEITSLIGKAIAEQGSKKYDPLHRTRQKLKKEKSRLEEVENEVKQEIEKAVELSLSEFEQDGVYFNK